MDMYEMVQDLGSAYCHRFLDVSVRALRKWCRGECQPRSRWMREAVSKALRDEHNRIIKDGGEKHKFNT